MIQDHVVDESTLKEYMELCGKLAEAASDKTVTDDAVTTSIQAGQVEIHYNDSVNISARSGGRCFRHWCPYDTEA